MNTLRWGVLGTGAIIAKGGNAIHRSPYSKWLGVAGRTKENSLLAANKYGVERVYASYQELVDDPDIDVVYIALLNHLHKEWALKAIQAGKHVLMEKPFTLNTKDATQIEEAAEKHHVQVMEAFVWRSHPAHQTVKSWIQEGEIGKLVHFIGHFSFVAGEGSSRWVKEWGGGALYDIGCYAVAWSRYFADEEPVAVDCQLTMHPIHQVDARCVGTLHYPNGKTAQISTAMDMNNGSFYEILGTRGRITVAFHKSLNELTITTTMGSKKQSWTTDRIEPFLYQVNAFSQSIRNNKVVYGMEDAVKQAKVLDGMFEADRLGRRIEF